MRWTHRTFRKWWGWIIEPNGESSDSTWDNETDSRINFLTNTNSDAKASKKTKFSNTWNHHHRRCWEQLTTKCPFSQGCSRFVNPTKLKFWLGRNWKAAVYRQISRLNHPSTKPPQKANHSLDTNDRTASPQGVTVNVNWEFIGRAIAALVSKADLNWNLASRRMLCSAHVPMLARHSVDIIVTS